MAEFNNRLKDVFRFSGFSQKELADFLGCNKSIICTWMGGRNTPNTVDKMKQVASFFNVNPAWLAGYDVPMTNLSIGKQEEELLAVYCKLNSLGKSRVDEYALDLTENEKYTKSDTEEGIKIA